MTHERIAINSLARCKFMPGTFDKRFARDLAATPENYTLTPKQRETLWRLVVRYRRQFTGTDYIASLVEHARWWLGRPAEQIAFEQMLDANPADAPTRLVYADWLEEQGDPACMAQRWMAERGIFPKLENVGQSYGPSGTAPINFEWTISMAAYEALCDRTYQYPMPFYWHPHRERAEKEIERLVLALTPVDP